MYTDTGYTVWLQWRSNSSGTDPDVNGEPKASTIIDGQNISFPYQLDISGAEGITSGTIYLYEEVDGDYQQLGTYTVTFKKAE